MQKLKFAPKISGSGQVFRAWINEDTSYFISGCEIAAIKDEIISSTNDEYFYNYFDFSTDYSIIEKELQMGSGVRILRGEFVEMVISFIISANNNIKRIKKTIAELCRRFGQEKTFGEIKYYAFPTVKKLLTITEDIWHEIGCGYRSKYLIAAVKELSVMSFEDLNRLSNDELYKKILAMHGVGDKVARCIMLFAFHRLDICPVDTRIMQRAGRFVSTVGKTPKTVAEALQKHFGRYAGVAQQYMFDS